MYEALALLAAFALALPVSVSVRADDKKKAKKPELTLRATPRFTFSPANILFTAELKGGDDIETTIFYMDMRTSGKDYEAYLERAKNELGVRLALAEMIRDAIDEDRRFFFLNRAAGGPFRRDTMQTYSERMVRILAGADVASTLQQLNALAA